MKRQHIVCLVALLCMVALVGVILSKNKHNNEDIEKDVIVHKIDENTVEEKVEEGLLESDSEDGPILGEENNIDFNGKNDIKDDNANETEPDIIDSIQSSNDDGKDNDNNINETEPDKIDGTQSGNDDSQNKNTEQESLNETGAFGIFY